MPDKERRNAISIGTPQIVPEKTESLHGDWITTGKIQLPILQGGDPAFGSLAFPYKDAASEADALKQVVTPLEAVVQELSLALSRLKDAESSA
jgi:hypothetical protein